jgi:predicted phosphodiesterase
VHGTPALNTAYWTEDRSEQFCTQMAELAGMRIGDIIACGHTHLAWKREVNGMHFVNTGSVGRPKDGDPRAGYVGISFETGSADIKILRVEYDVARTARGIRESELPDELAAFLETGGRVP